MILRYRVTHDFTNFLSNAIKGDAVRNSLKENKGGGFDKRQRRREDYHGDHKRDERIEVKSDRPH
jgi:hypothetical protein